MRTELKVLQTTDREDLYALLSVFEEMFEMENFQRPSENHLSGLLHNDHFVAVVARMENQVIGGLTLYILPQYYSEKPLAYLYDLAVLTPHQRKGVGQSLLQFACEFGRQRGFEAVFVQAAREDDQAMDFYRRTTPTREEHVVHFTYHLQR